MTIIIHTSPTLGSKKGSISELMLKTFLTEFKKHDKNEIQEINLNTEPMASKTLTSENFATFFNDKDSDHYIKQLKSASKIIIVSPMTNFNYPAVLKNYLDHVLVANKTFKYKYDGKGESEGLLTHLKVQLLTTQGADLGWYPWGNVASMLKGTWEFMGTTVSKPVTIYGTKTPAKINLTIEEVVSMQLKEIKEAAAKF